MDPSLKKHDKALRTLVKKILESKPDAQADARFVAKLRNELMTKKSNKFNIFNMNKIPFVVVAATGTIAIILVASVIFLANQSPLTNSIKFAGNIKQEGNFIELSAGAFGDLGGNISGGTLAPQAEAGVVTMDASSGELKASNAIGIGGGGGMAMNASSEEMARAVSASAPMMMPAYYSYQFKYTGGDFEIADSQMPVYRLALDKTTGKTMASALSGVSFNFLDLSKFRNASVKSVYMAQDDGFNIYLNLDQGRVSIDSNTPYMMKGDIAVCDGPGCGGYEQQNFPELSESQLISIADKFLSDYGINQTAFGKPFADLAWKINTFYQSYTPRLQSVIYPVSLDGKIVYESGGQPSGMRVVIDSVDNKVRSVNEIFNPVFEKSNYEIETDFNRILKFAERGGVWNSYYGAAEEGETLDLGAPEYVYMHQYDYSQSDGVSRELYVPALRFPILNSEGKNIYQDAIIIPLAKEILDRYDISDDDYRIRPMPEPYLLEETESSPPDVMPIETDVMPMGTTEGTASPM